jgi:hypothetical protein
MLTYLPTVPSVEAWREPAGIMSDMSGAYMWKWSSSHAASKYRIGGYRKRRADGAPCSHRQAPSSSLTPEWYSSAWRGTEPGTVAAAANLTLPAASSTAAIFGIWSGSGPPPGRDSLSKGGGCRFLRNQNSRATGAARRPR